MAEARVGERPEGRGYGAGTGGGAGLRGGTGAMITFYDGYLRPISFIEMIDYSTGKVKIRTVDITSETYEVGRKYMIRLEKEDFAPGNAEVLAKTAGMDVENFSKRFSYLVE